MGIAKLRKESVAGTTQCCAVSGTNRHLGFGFGSFARDAGTGKSALWREGAGRGGGGEDALSVLGKTK